MHKYYNEAMKLNRSYFMYKIGSYHQYITNDYEKMKYYYDIAINLGNTNAMNNLGKYYQNESGDHNTRDYTLMKVYYKMAIKLNDSDAMFNLGWYYEFVDVNYEKSFKYYLKAMSNGDLKALSAYIYHNYFHEKPFIIDFDVNVFYGKIYKFDTEIINYIKKEIVLFNVPNIIYDIYNKKVDFCVSDFKIITNNEIFNIHTFVLDSNYFKNLLSGKFISKREINMGETSEKTIKILLDYLYLGIFDFENISYEILDELEEICDEYEFLNLLENCKIAKILKTID